MIAAHGNLVAEATGPGGASVGYASPATTDAVDGAGTASCAPASGSTFGLGTHTVSCNAIDAAGNHAAATSFTVTVRDTTAPAIAPHADVNVVGEFQLQRGGDLHDADGDRSCRCHVTVTCTPVVRQHVQCRRDHGQLHRHRRTPATPRPAASRSTSATTSTASSSRSTTPWSTPSRRAARSR